MQLRLLVHLKHRDWDGLEGEDVHCFTVLEGTSKARSFTMTKEYLSELTEISSPTYEMKHSV